MALPPYGVSQRKDLERSAAVKARVTELILLIRHLGYLRWFNASVSTVYIASF